ncbi:MAG: hypothetical protein ACHQ17_04745 [Polyangia bacterium]|jgi:hypothetical protein
MKIAAELWERARRLLVDPRAELPRMLAESGDRRAILIPYVVALAAIGPVAGFVSEGVLGTYQPATTLFGTTVPAMYVRAPGVALVVMLLRYVVSVGAWFAFAGVLERLSPHFGGRRDPGGAYKTAAAVATPLWVVGALGLFGSVPHLDVAIWIGGAAALSYGVLIGMWAVPLHLATPEPKAAGHVLSTMSITVIASAAAYWLLHYLLIAPFAGLG